MKRLFLLFFIVATTVAAKAQEEAEDNKGDDHMVFNPEVGLNATQYTGYGNNFRLGYTLAAHFRLGTDFYIQAGAAFTKYAVNTDVHTDDTSYVAGTFSDISSYYVQFPLMAGFKLVNLEHLNFRVAGGYVPSIYMGSDIRNATISREDFKRTTHALRVGIGMDVLILTLNAYYDWGVTDVFAQPKNVTYQQLTLAAGIRIF
ncbi:MAG TPA: porin family protein [Bacteroidia bacterium]|nr:porin family protein [Bacteroidia bacterium]